MSGWVCQRDVNTFFLILAQGSLVPCNKLFLIRAQAGGLRCCNLALIGGDIFSMGAIKKKRPCRKPVYYHITIFAK